MKLLSDRVAVVADPDRDEKMVGSIIIPIMDKERYRCGTVAEVGYKTINETEKVPISDIAPGDRVLFGKFTGTEFVDDDGKKYLIMRHADIIMSFQEGTKIN